MKAQKAIATNSRSRSSTNTNERTEPMPITTDLEKTELFAAMQFYKIACQELHDPANESEDALRSYKIFREIASDHLKKVGLPSLEELESAHERVFAESPAL